MPILDFLCTPYTCLALTPGWPTAYMPYREIMYRDFAMSDVQSSCQYQNPIPETLTRAKIYGSDSFWIQRLRLNRDFGVFVVEWTLHIEIPIPESPMAYLPCNFCRSDGCRPFEKFGWDPTVTGSLSSFFSVNSCCARFLQCCSSWAFTSESPRVFILHILPFLLLPSKTTIINTHSLLVQYWPTECE